MAPRPKRITKLGDLLRKARAELRCDQATFGARTASSTRSVCRWENGVTPTGEQTSKILEACEDLPPDLYLALAEALGVTPEEPPSPVPPEPPAPSWPVPAPGAFLLPYPAAPPPPTPPEAPAQAPVGPAQEPSPAPEPPTPAVAQAPEASGAAELRPASTTPPRPDPAALRAEIDAIVYGTAEERDVYPRHLRAFAVELAIRADQLGITMRELAELVAAKDRAGARRLDAEPTAAETNPGVDA
jgi:transcriptional regulator with XRE-family HTH domain